MKLANLDRDPNYSQGGGPLRLSLQRLNTLLHSPSIRWNPKQREAAAADLLAALTLMETDVLTLAGRHFPNAEPARMTDKAEGIRERIDRVERETLGECRAGEPGCNPANCVECPRPQECPASGAGHSDGPHGMCRETQCAYCGQPPQEVAA